MTTVNVKNPKKAPAETPSEQLVKQADAAITIETPNGFKVTLKKPGVLSQFRLIRMLGDAAKNETYTNMLLPLTYVTAINGQVVNAANTERELEALIVRLDDEGVTAVMSNVVAHFGQAQAPEAVQEEIKN